jgi:receptor protein-tyrosine kinase/non-specific protein-tyrosine kinase
MSRIEKAMEKAAQLRQGGSSAVDGYQPSSLPGIARVTVHHDPQHRQDAVLPVVSDNPLLVNLNAPYSVGAEEIRKVKTLLLNKTKQDGFKNTLMITSAIPGEGKTLTSLNLAISLAEELDHTVLLVEADFRRPSMHHYLPLEDKPGLSSCLLGEVDLRDTIIPTGIGKLSIIRAGHSVPNPSELFSSQRAKDLIIELKSRYPDRYIIFDTPPLLPFTEARSLATLVDSIIFVAMERNASSHDIKDALEVLKGCPVLGMIYNGAEHMVGDKRYSYYQRYAEGKND